jgi:formylglycine-generating enzyme required for sulfatase activity
MRWIKALLVLLALLAPLAVAGCGSNSDSKGLEVQLGGVCARTADCLLGLRCVGLVCVEAPGQEDVVGDQGSDALIQNDSASWHDDRAMTDRWPEGWEDTVYLDTWPEDYHDPYRSVPPCSPNCTAPGLVWVDIPGGTFTMGCSSGDTDCAEDELPAHSVTITTFEMLETEVTEAQFEAVTSRNPSCTVRQGGGPEHPVECMTLFKARDHFCEAIGGRLPTEAEWEYAARAGSTTRYPCGDDAACLDAVAWFVDNSEGGKHAVKTTAPNAFGLYDMLGNVWEWTSDRYGPHYYTDSPSDNPQGPAGGSYNVVRGGSSGNDAGYLRVSRRMHEDPSKLNGGVGFRCARTKPL